MWKKCSAEIDGYEHIKIVVLYLSFIANNFLPSTEMVKLRLFIFVLTSLAGRCNTEQQHFLHFGIEATCKRLKH